MNRFVLFLVLTCTSQVIYAQYVYTIKADSVKITNSCDTAELIIENHTQTVPGFLYNKGRGRTEFRRGAIALNDSLYVIGGDTINLYKGRVNVTASNGLYAENSHVKLGGAIRDVWSDLWFDFTPEDISNGNTYRQLSIYSHDMNSGLTISEDYGQNVSQTDLRFDAVNPSYQSSGFGCGNYGFYVHAKTQSVDRFVKLDSSGFRVINSPMAVGFPAGGPEVVGAGKALFQIAAGTSAAGGAPMKFTPGTLLTTLENNAIEYDGYDLYLTEHSVRYKLAKTFQGQLTTNFGGASLSAFNAVNTTLTVAGAQPGDVVTVSSNSGAVNPPSIMITAYVTSANTVTIQAYNASNSAVTLASDTYKVRVVK